MLDGNFQGKANQRMTFFLCVVCFILGVLLGRFYGWMKYHYPEFQEEINLRVSTKRAQRYRQEYEIERMRSKIDDDLDRRIHR